MNYEKWILKLIINYRYALVTWSRFYCNTISKTFLHSKIHEIMIIHES